MRLAKAHGVATMIWAVTARNFGHYYVAHGVDSVISDPAPFLLLRARPQSASGAARADSGAHGPAAEIQSGQRPRPHARRL